MDQCSIVKLIPARSNKDCVGATCKIAGHNDVVFNKENFDDAMGPAAHSYILKHCGCRGQVRSRVPLEVKHDRQNEELRVEGE